MPMKNPSIHVIFGKSTAGLLSNLAHQEHKSVASLVRELALEALDMREDYYLSKIAEEYDVQGAKTYSHEDAWK
jgi:hypothetical protein